MSSRPPTYSRHSSGQARCRLHGKTHYLGAYGSIASYEEHARLLELWRESLRAAPPDLTIRALCTFFLRHARLHYRKNGQPTKELFNFRTVAKRMVAMYGTLPASEFSPLKLKRLRQGMIDDGWSRKSINKQIVRVRTIIAWAIGDELLKPDILVGLKTVRGLEESRSEARETEPITPVSAATVNATLQHCGRHISAMIRLQFLAGCRPGEVCAIRPMDIDRSGDTWIYRPESHKTQHHGKERRIHIGPQAQAALLPFLDRPADAYCFSPAEADVDRKVELRANRKTRVQPSQISRRRAQPKRKPGDRYSTDAYGRAIKRACVTARVEAWAPNRLRHSRATQLEEQFGIEVAQHVLGHAKPDMTRVYAAQNHQRAATAMAEVG